MLRQIGEGGMGAVWMAEHAMLGRRAAIKILHPSFSVRQDIVTRFFNEARAATAISDPGIIQIFDFGFHTDGSAYIVMELLDGEPLDRRLRRLGTLSVGDALRICRQVASAVGAAHARGITHRDLKPENIFIVRDSEVAGGERAKVLDFGIAKLAGDLTTQQKTSTSAIMGTPHYMSPEQCRGAGKVDQRSDVYSLGCVLFALVTGHAPFSAEGTGEIIMQHMIEPPPRPSTRAVGVAAEIDDLILRCLAKNPADRFASGTELAAAIGVLMERSSITHASSLPPPPAVTTSPAQGDTTLGSSAAFVASPTRPEPSSRGKLYAGVAAILLAGGVAVAVVASRSSSDAPESTAEVAAASTPATEAEKLSQSPPPSPAPSPAPPVPPRTAEDLRQGGAKTGIRELLAAFSKWAADHAGAPCPTVAELGGRSDPWSHAYQLTCTDQPADQVVGVISMGPDGVAGTDDDLTSWTLGREVTDLARGKRWVSAPVAAKALPPTPAPATAKISPPTAAPATGKASPPTSAPATAKAPSPTPVAPPLAPAKKPTSPAAPPKPSIVDINGDGIPDTR